MQLAPCQRGLQQVRRVHRALGLACAYQRVHLVDEQHDFPGRGRDLGQDRLQPLLELAPVLRPGNQRAHVERHQPLVAQALRHVAVDDAQRKALGNRGLADARFADQHGVVLGPARQHLHGAAYLVIAPDDRVDLALARGIRQVAGVFLQRVIALLGTRRVRRPALADVVDRRVDALRGDRPGIQRLLGAGLDQRQRGQQPFDRHKAVARLLGDRLGLVQHTHQARVHIDLPVAARDLGLLRNRRIDRAQHLFRAAARPADQVRRQPLVVIHQRLEQMFGQHALVAFPHRDGLRGLQEPARPFRELLHVHRPSPLVQRPTFGPPDTRHGSPCGPRSSSGHRAGGAQGHPVANPPQGPIRLRSAQRQRPIRPAPSTAR